MSVHILSVMVHTDDVPGKFHQAEDFVPAITEILGNTIGHYVDSVTLLTDDHLHEDSIPLAEFQYLKDHSVYELLERLRDVQARSKTRLLVIDDLLDEAIKMISALNAVKVVGETKAAKVAQANAVFTELVEDEQLFEDMCHLEPALMDRLRKILL